MLFYQTKRLQDRINVSFQANPIVYTTLQHSELAKPTLIKPSAPLGASILLG